MFSITRAVPQLVAAALLVISAGDANEMTFGHFTGTVKVEWVRSQGQDLRMKLLEDFSYVDPKSKAWTAQKGYETDGASIPKAFWSIVGGPFEGGYREAAVIHDWYCDKKTEPWRDVHRIFYYASRAAGVPEQKAKIMYAAVRIGGPKWGTNDSHCYSCHINPETYSVDKYGRVVNIPRTTVDDAQRIAKWVQDSNPSLEHIDAFAKANFPDSKFGHE